MKKPLLLAILVVTVLLLLLIKFWEFKGAAFVEDVPTAATKVLGSLLVITLFVERCLAAINTTLYGKEKAVQEGQLRSLEVQVDTGALPVTNVEALAKVARDKLNDIAGKEAQNRAVLAFAFALLICAAGVRTLSALIEIENICCSSQKALAHIVDVVLTAGLISGGSDALAQLIKAILDAAKAPPRYR